MSAASSPARTARRLREELCLEWYGCHPATVTTVRLVPWMPWREQAVTTCQCCQTRWTQSTRDYYLQER